MDLSDAMDNTVTSGIKLAIWIPKNLFQRESFSWRRCQSDKSSASIKIPLSLSGSRNRLRFSGSIPYPKLIYFPVWEGRFRSNLSYFFSDHASFHDIERERDEKWPTLRNAVFVKRSRCNVAKLCRTLFPGPNNVSISFVGVSGFIALRGT